MIQSKRVKNTFEIVNEKTRAHSRPKTAVVRSSKIQKRKESDAMSGSYHYKNLREYMYGYDKCFVSNIKFQKKGRSSFMNYPSELRTSVNSDNAHVLMKKDSKESLIQNLLTSNHDVVSEIKSLQSAHKRPESRNNNRRLDESVDSKGVPFKKSRTQIKSDSLTGNFIYFSQQWSF